MSGGLFQSLVRESAAPYRAAGLRTYFTVRGKFAGDPLFRAVIEQDLIPDSARFCDLGCGPGLLLALLGAARTMRSSTTTVSMTGIDHDRRGLHIARKCCPLARFYRADLAQAPVPSCDAVALFDVLHYLSPEAQLGLLQRIRAALSPGGRLLLRVADAARDLRLTLAVDRIGARWRGLPAPPFHPRPLIEWRERLGELGFRTEVQPMAARLPFPNVVIVARLDAHAC